MELQAALYDLDAGRLNRTNVFMKGIFGRMKTITVTEATTFNFTMELETSFLGLRIGLHNLHTSEVPGVKVAVASTAANHGADYINNANPSNGAWYDLTCEGQSTGTLKARVAAERPSVTWFDLLGVENVPRADGAGRPLVMVRIEVPAGSVLTVPYNALYYWRTNQAPRMLRVAKQAVLGVTNKAEFTASNTVDADAPVPLVNYVSSNQGHQVAIGGDSLHDGLGGNVRSYGFVQRVCAALSTPEKPVEWFNLGLHSQTSDVYSQYMAENLEMIAPTHISYAPYTVNDVPVGGMNSGTEVNQKFYLSRILRAMNNLKKPPRLMLLEGAPTNPAYRNFGTNDYRRREMNAWLATVSGAVALRGFADALSGPENANGQTTIKEGMHSDNVHFTDPGYEAGAAAIRDQVASLMQ